MKNILNFFYNQQISLAIIDLVLRILGYSFVLGLLFVLQSIFLFDNCCEWITIPISINFGALGIVYLVGVFHLIILALMPSTREDKIKINSISLLYKKLLWYLFLFAFGIELFVTATGLVNLFNPLVWLFNIF